METEQTSIQCLTQAVHMLDKARTVKEAKQVSDLAAAAIEWARKAGLGLEAQNKAAWIKLQAERKAGELLTGLERKPGVATSGIDATGSSEYRSALQEADTDYRTAARWQREATVPAEDFAAWAASEVKAGRELTSAALLRQAIRLYHATLKREPPKPPVGKYSCIVIDPPWEMEIIERDVRRYQLELPYPSMTIEEIEALPIGDLGADDSHLFLWTTQKHLPAALRVAAAWGFRYQCLLTWVKNVGFTPYSWMYSTEHVLFCRKGSLKLNELGVRLDFAAKVREHSRKPDEFYDIVRRVSPEPRIDCFSREPREGFAQWGNEVEKFTAEETAHALA